MDLDRLAVKLCILGTQAEFERRTGDAQKFYKQAWDSATDDYEKCIAAHYIAHLETDPHTALDWNLSALKHAQKVKSELVNNFFPSLFVNLAHSYEVTGDSESAMYYYELAANLGLIHQI